MITNKAQTFHTIYKHYSLLLRKRVKRNKALVLKPRPATGQDPESVSLTSCPYHLRPLLTYLPISYPSHLPTKILYIFLVSTSNL